jgi:hypothetical protein
MVLLIGNNKLIHKLDIGCNNENFFIYFDLIWALDSLIKLLLALVIGIRHLNIEIQWRKTYLQIIL